MSPHVPSDRDIMVMIINAKERPPSRVAAFLVRESGTTGDPPVMDSAEGGAVGFPQQTNRGGRGHFLRSRPPSFLEVIIVKTKKIRMYRPEFEVETNNRVIAWMLLVTRKVFWPQLKCIRLTMHMNGKKLSAGKLRMIIWPKIVIKKYA